LIQFEHALGIQEQLKLAFQSDLDHDLIEKESKDFAIYSINIAAAVKIITRILSHGYSLNARPDLSYK